MFEGLTRHLPDLEKAENSGNYGRTIYEIEQAVYTFVDEHPEFGLTRYGEILEQSGLKWDGRIMSEADVSELDGRTTMALLIGAVRAERFCDGALIEFFENGSVKRWIARLSEIDGPKG